MPRINLRCKFMFPAHSIGWNENIGHGTSHESCRRWKFTREKKRLNKIFLVVTIMNLSLQKKKKEEEDDNNNQSFYLIWYKIRNNNKRTHIIKITDKLLRLWFIQQMARMNVKQLEPIRSSHSQSTINTIQFVFVVRRLLCMMMIHLVIDFIVVYK